MNANDGLRFGILFLSLVLLGSFRAGASQHLYLSAGGKLTVFAINADSGRLTLTQEVELAGAGPMGASPDRGYLYVNASLPAETGKKSQPGIATFAVGNDGSVSLKAHHPVRLSAGYLRSDATGRYLAGNNYGKGTATIWKLAEDRCYRGETVQEMLLEQRAHSAVFAPDNRFLLVPATGPNKVFQLRFDASSGAIAPNDPPFAPGPEGEGEARQPRHLIFHPSLPIAYTTNERELPGVGVWAWNGSTGSLRTIQNLVSIPPGFSGVMTTADLHLTPDGRYLYVSNRDLTDRKARLGNSSLAGFAVDPATGKLSPIGHFPCEHVPRSFDIDETGRFVYVAGQSDDRLGVYLIESESGNLTRVEQHEVGARPSWVHCMQAP